MKPFMELSRRGVRRSRVTALVSPLNPALWEGPPSLASGRCAGLKGKTPEATISVMLAVGSKPGGPFTRVDKGSYTLADTGSATTKPARRKPATRAQRRQRASKQPRGRRPRRRSRRERSGGANSTARVAPSGSHSRGSRSSFITNVAGRHWRWSEGALVRLAVALDELGFELREPTLERVAEWTARGLTGL
jgi:hypothetical protein